MNINNKYASENLFIQVIYDILSRKNLVTSRDEPELAKMAAPIKRVTAWRSR